MIDFVVQGTPRSQQAKNKKGWIERVQRAVPSTADLLEGPLRVRIDFFFRGSTDLDTDNIIKPIQDALKEILYDDDETVVDVCARKDQPLPAPYYPQCPRQAATSIGRFVE